MWRGKGIPIGIEVSQVKDDQEGLGFKIESVVRLRKDSKSPYDMVAVTSERNEIGKKLFEVKNIGGFRVKIESKKKPVTLKQCFNCQGHVQYRCSGKEICAFCAEEHPSRECTGPKGKGKDAKCRNCQDNHSAFMRSCPKHPAQLTRVAEEEKMRKIREVEVRSGLSYLDRVRASSSNKTANKKSTTAATGPKGSVGSMEAIVEALRRRLLPKIIKTING